MEGHVNTYTGMNKDMGRDTIPANLYIDALDIRITTTNGESMGSFTNMKGNVEAFTIPTSGNFNGSGWTAASPEIIGYTTIRNRIILFVADDSGTKGWIYDVQYNTATRAILPSFPNLLYYSDLLNFKKDWPIEALGRYESDCIQRVYWTDYNNFLRSINIADSDLATLPAGLIDIYPDVEFVQPLLKVVSGGGSLLSGVYQAAYRLITSDGKKTLVSPPSNLIHIVRSDENLGQSAAYVGEASEIVNTGKSITIEVDTTNYSTFDKIEFLVLYYDVADQSPEVYSVETQTIGGASSVNFIYTGVEGELTTVELLEFTSKNVAFKTSKTIAQKDSTLVVANIKGSNIRLQDLLGNGETFFAKTRRYRGDGATPFPIGAGNDQDDLDNAFNVSTSSGGFGYNSDAHWDQDWHDTRQYRFQSDRSTLGGEGPNISYKFHLEPMSLDGDTQAGFNNISNVLQPYDNHDLNDGYGVYTNLSFPTFASPYHSGLLRGYKRGEVYRFGIIFYTNKGEATYVEYIGDIKFPDISEEDGVINASGTTFFPLSLQDPANPTITIGYSLGIEFTLDFSTCPTLLNNITGYQIVRTQRNVSNRKRLAQGIIKNTGLYLIDPPPAGTLFDFQVNSSSDVLHLIEAIANPAVTPKGIDRKPHGLKNLFDQEFIPGTTIDGVQYDTVTPFAYNQGAYPKVKSQYLGFYSPEISFSIGSSISALTNLGNSLSMLATGLYEGSNNVIIDSTTKNLHASGIQLAQTGRDYRYKTKNVEPIEFNRITNIRKIKKVEYFKMDDTFGLTNQYRATDLWDNFYVRNYYACSDDILSDDLNNPTALPATNTASVSKSGSSLLLQTERYTVDPLTNNPLTNKVPFDFFFPTGMMVEFGTINLVQGIDQVDNTYPIEDKLLIVDITSGKDEQYGGYTQSALEANVFIIASPIINPSQTNPKVFGGDIFVNMTTLQTSMVDLDINLFELNGASNPQYYAQSISRTELFVMESIINQDLQVGSNLKTGVGYEFNGSDPQEMLRQEFNNTFTLSGLLQRMYGYNFVFNREDNEVAFFVESDNNASGCTVNDVRAYLSNVKTNNEQIDAWTNFPIANYYDIDDYGPINKIINFKDNIYFLQDRASGVYAINRTAITTTDDGVPTELGSKDGFSKHNYISKEHGSIHQWAVTKTDSGIYFFDAINRKIFLLGPTQGGGAGNNPISELKGIHSFVNLLPDGIFVRKEDGGDNPFLNKGVHIGNDTINDEIIFTFLGSGTVLTVQPDTLYLVGDIVLFTISPISYRVITTETDTTGLTQQQSSDLILANSQILKRDFRVNKTSIVYDELLQSFSTRLSQTPTIWINNYDILLSPNSQTSGSENVIYTHNIGNYGEFYGSVIEANLSLVINPKVDFNKVLRFLEFNSIVRDDNKNIDRDKTITAFRIYNEYQDSGKILYSTNRFKRRFDKWRLKLPRDINSVGNKSRFRSTYFIVTLYFDNQENRELIMNKLLSFYDLQVY